MRTFCMVLFFICNIAYAVSQDFSLIILPDTQYYSQSHPEIFYSQIDWILANRDALNIQFVIHLGDITNNGTQEEWDVAKIALGKLDGVIPYALTIGNHDYTQKRTRDIPEFYADYPVSEAPPTLRGTFEPGKLENNYHILDIGSTSYLIMGLEFGPRDEVLAWANQIIEQHPECKVMMFTHSYMHSDDTRVGEGDIHNPHDYYIEGLGSVNDGEEMWEKMVSLHQNMLMTFSGHVVEGDCTGRLDSEGINGNIVVQMLSNYQTMEKGGNGFLRILTFHPLTRDIDVTTFSPYINTFLTNAENQFTIDEFDNAFNNAPPVIDLIPEFACREDSTENILLSTLENYIQDDQTTFEELNIDFVSSQHIYCEKSDSHVTFSFEENWFGRDSVKIHVTDSQNLTTSAELIFNIEPVNDAPILADIPDIVGNEDAPITTLLTPFLFDPDHQLAELSVNLYAFEFIPGSAGTQLHDLYYTYNPQTQQLQCTASVNVYGEFRVHLNVCDPVGLCQSDTLSIIFNNVNDKPQLVSTPEIMFNEDQEYTFTVQQLNSLVADDNSHDELIWDMYDGNHTSVKQENTYFIVKGDSNWFGQDSLMLVVRDVYGLADSGFINIEIQPLNDAPHITKVPNVEFPEDSTASLNIAPFLADVDHAIDELTLSAKVLNHTPIPLSTVAIATTQDLIIKIEGKTAYFSSQSDSCGLYAVELRVCDPAGACGSDTIFVTVIPQNDPPIIAPLPPLSWQEDDSLLLTHEYILTFADDPDHAKQDLKILLSSSTVSIDSTKNGWRLETARDWFGDDSVFVTLSDPFNASVSTVQKVYIEPVNDPPVWQTIPSMQLHENDSLEINLNNYLRDIDNEIQELYIQQILTASPNLYAYLNQDTHSFTLKSTVQYADTVHITFSATDPQGGVAETIMTVLLLPVNNAPEIQPLPAISLQEDSEIILPASYWQNYISDIDHDKSELSVKIFASENINIRQQDGIFTLQPKANWYGVDNLLVRVTDPLASADSSKLPVFVSSVNDLPTISNLPDSLYIDSNIQKFLLWYHINDVETPDSALGINIINQCSSFFAYYDKTTGELLLLNTTNEECSNWLKIIVTDEENATAQDSIWVMYQTTSSVKNNAILTELTLHPCFPNPFNGVTRIQYDLPTLQHVRVYVINVRGQHICDLENDTKKAGHYSLTWEIKNLSSGIYFIILETTNRRLIRRSLLVN